MLFQPLRELTQKVIKLNQNRLLFEVIADNKDLQNEILDLNRVNQLFDEGIQADGNDLNSSNSTQGVYSSYTEQVNKGRVFTYKGHSKSKIAGDKYFLYDSGFWFNSFKINASNNFFEIDAAPTRGKTNMLDEYGSDILGLTDQSKQTLQKLLIPLLQTKLKQKL